jgi:predicted small metal-binding protein
MRVIECNECGETISAVDDQELMSRLSTHLGEEHEEAPDEEELELLVADEAYDALDS